MGDKVKKKKILLLYTNYGTGHYMAAKGIEEHINIKYPTYEVELFDPLSYSRPIVNKIFAKFGRLMATRFRRCRGIFYKNIMYKNYLKIPLFYKFCGNFFWTKKLNKKMMEINPDIIISTQVGPTALITNHKGLFKAKLVTVFTDYGLHRLYVCAHELIDMFCVPNKDIRKQMINLGIKSKKIKVTGIPVRDNFISKKYNNDRVIKKYKLKNRPIFTFMCGGGLGYDNAFSYFKTLLQMNYDFSYIFISGKNERLRKKAQKLANKYNKNGQVFGYVTNVDEFISCSDLVFGKPGGITTSECLNLGTPICAIEPIPGQENNNALFISNNEFGFYITSKTDFMLFLNKIKNNEINLYKYKKNIKRKFSKFKFINISKI